MHFLTFLTFLTFFKFSAFFIFTLVSAQALAHIDHALGDVTHELYHSIFLLVGLLALANGIGWLRQKLKKW